MSSHRAKLTRSHRLPEMKLQAGLARVPLWEGLHQHKPQRESGQKGKKCPLWSESNRVFVCVVMCYLLFFLPLNDLWLGKMSNMMYGACGRSPDGVLVRFHFFCFPSIKCWGHAYPYVWEIWTAISRAVRAGRGILSVYLRVDLVNKRVQNSGKSGKRSESSLEGTLWNMLI